MFVSKLSEYINQKTEEYDSWVSEIKNLIDHKLDANQYDLDNNTIVIEIFSDELYYTKFNKYFREYLKKSFEATNTEILVSDPINQGTEYESYIISIKKIS